MKWKWKTAIKESFVLGSAADVGCVNRMPDSTTKEEGKKINELSYLSKLWIFLNRYKKI
jgi:hypothetical protein